mmetsp:Transcript_2622/g.6090  ORF Transcript_2622/g.6090 Transcript_2622/m.6090 type:complete len:355 (+) Transcript_2622:787-1851(+)
MGGGVSSGPKNFPLYLSLSTNKMDEERQGYEKLFPVWCIALCPNGKQLAAASSDNKIHLWCLMTYQLLISLTGHGDTIWCVQYSPDCQVLASASSDGTIRLWEVDTGFPISILRAHANWVWCLQFAPNSQNFASAGADTRIFLWDVDQNIPLLGKSAHAKSVQALCFAPTDGRKMVTVGADSIVCVWHVNWEIPTCDLRARLEGHLGVINSVAVSPNSDTFIVSAGEDCVARLWNLKDLTKDTARESIDKPRGYNLEHHQLTGHTEAIYKCAFSQCGRILATVGRDSTVRIWNVAPSKAAFKASLQTSFKAHEAWVRDCCFSRDNMILFTCSTDGLVSMWKVPKRFHIRLEEDA